MGKLNFFNVKRYMNEEDKLALRLRQLFQDYETRVSLAMIPFYMERLAFIEDELEQKQHPESYGVKPEEISFLVRTRDEVQRALEKEKLEVNAMANELYELWLAIEAERETKKYASTNVALKVHKQELANGGSDFMFNLTYGQPSERTAEDKALPGSEASRRNGARRLQTYAVLLINDKKVSKTRKVPVNWPTFEAKICEMFQVHVFTMPSSIRVELVLVDGILESVVDVVDVEVPGQHVKALTCSCPLVQQLAFSKVAFEKRRLAKKYAAQSYKPEGLLSEAQKQKLAAEQSKRDKIEEVKRENDIEGELFVKAEWKGTGPKMPPIRSENLLKKPKVQKNRKEYSREEELMMLLKQLYIDVNDPRNQSTMKLLRETKNEFLVGLLRADARNLLADAAPFRHKLLLARQKDAASFAHTFVPMLEGELIDSARSPFFLEQLETLFRNEAYQLHLAKRVE